jgi:putative FmdB family regulatory protein
VPTYDYRCKGCGKHLEVVQAFTDDALTECPECSGELRKVFGSVGISFKGSGFYKTDSRGSSATATSGSSSGSSKDSASTDSGGSSGSDSTSSDSGSSTKSSDSGAATSA